MGPRWVDDFELAYEVDGQYRFPISPLPDQLSLMHMLHGVCDFVPDCPEKKSGITCSQLAIFGADFRS